MINIYWRLRYSDDIFCGKSKRAKEERALAVERRIRALQTQSQRTDPGPGMHEH